MRKSSFSYEVIDGVLCLIDLNEGGMSVTNDIENVLSEVYFNERRSQPGLYKLPIVYRDSDGTWDGVSMRNGEADFIPIHSSDCMSAIIQIKKHWQRCSSNDLPQEENLNQ